jgi:acyl carrier protein
MISITENQGRIIELLAEVMKTKGLAAPSMGPDTVLDQLGLESLDFAQVVIRMEEITGKDPFATGAEYQIKTLSDFAVLYD